MWMLLLVRANWVGGNYNQPLFPQNGLDKDWYCNSAFISISFQRSLLMDVCVCVCRFCSCLFERDFVHELSDVGNEHVEVCESVNGFTVKGKHRRIYHNDEMRWEERWKRHIWLEVSEKWIALYLILGRYSVKAWAGDRKLDGGRLLCVHTGWRWGRMEVTEFRSSTGPYVFHNNLLHFIIDRECTFSDYFCVRVWKWYTALISDCKMSPVESKLTHRELHFCIVPFIQMNSRVTYWMIISAEVRHDDVIFIWVLACADGKLSGKEFATMRICCTYTQVYLQLVFFYNVSA